MRTPLAELNSLAELFPWPRNLVAPPPDNSQHHFRTIHRFCCSTRGPHRSRSDTIGAVIGAVSRRALVSGAQCVNGDLALDAFDVDGLRVALHRRQQVRGPG